MTRIELYHDNTLDRVFEFNVEDLIKKDGNFLLVLGRPLVKYIRMVNNNDKYSLKIKHIDKH